MILIGCDFALNSWGMAIARITDTGLIQGTPVTSSSVLPDSFKGNFRHKIALHTAKLATLVKQFSPDPGEDIIMILEDIFLGGNARNSLQLAQVQGVVKYLFQDAGSKVRNILSVPASTWQALVKSKSQGNKADKVFYSVYFSKLFDIPVYTEHEGDALGILYFGLSTLQKLDHIIKSSAHGQTKVRIESMLLWALKAYINLDNPSIKISRTKSPKGGFKIANQKLSPAKAVQYLLAEENKNLLSNIKNELFKSLSK